MASKPSLTVTEDLNRYIIGHGHNGDPLLAELAEETAKLGPISVMQIAPEQGTFLTILVRAIGARTALEIGTFTGYSAICIARGLSADGHLTCCDVNAEWTAIGRHYWERAGVASRITLHLGPAGQTLSGLPATAPLDFAFIDADKSNYRTYYEESLKRLRPNGLIVLDNVLWSGKIIDPSDQTTDTKALREINDFISLDRRVDAVMVPIADGLTIVRKK